MLCLLLTFFHKVATFQARKAVKIQTPHRGYKHWACQEGVALGLPDVQVMSRVEEEFEKGEGQLRGGQLWEVSRVQY